MLDPNVAAVQCIKAAFLTVLVASIVIVLLGLSPLWIIACMVAGIPLALIYGFLYGCFFGASRESEEESDPEFDEPSEPEEAQGTAYFFEDDNGLDTEYSEGVVGLFRESKIYEYVIVNHPEKPGQKLKCHYDRVVRDGEDFIAPEGWFVLIEPGILYVNTDPENVVGAADSEE